MKLETLRRDIWLEKLEKRATKITKYIIFLICLDAIIMH